MALRYGLPPSTSSVPVVDQLFQPSFTIPTYGISNPFKLETYTCDVLDCIKNDFNTLQQLKSDDAELLAKTQKNKPTITELSEPVSISNCYNAPLIEPLRSVKEQSVDIESKQLIVKKPRSHTCRVCNHINSDFDNYNQHLVSTHADLLLNTEKTTLNPVKTKELPVICVICNHVLANNEQLRNHTRLIHLPPILFQKVLCKFCKQYYDSDKLNKHIEFAHSGDRVHKCEDCGNVYTIKKSLIKHKLKCERGGEPVECTICGTKCNNPFALNSHITTMHREPLVFANGQPIEIDSTKTTLKKILALRCKICNCCNVDYYSYTQHLVSVHADVLINTQKVTLNPILTEASQVICVVCNKIVKNNKYLPTHTKTHLPKNITQQHVCNKCGNSYNRAGLKQHLKTVHNDAKPFSCEVCDKTFKNAHSLKKHMKCHSSIKRYQCDVCGKQLSSIDSFHDHKLIHAGIKSFQCYDCGKMFTTKKYLMIHIFSHAREKPHSCSICDKKFTQRGSLTLHIRKHTGEKPYKCDLCEKAFIAKSIMNMHKKKTHKVC